MSKTDHPIGIFDSGVGGLTVFREIARALPHHPLIYLGDSARVPYGTKSPQTVIRYSIEAANHLLGRGIGMLVVACNTATAAALPTLKERLSTLQDFKDEAEKAFIVAKLREHGWNVSKTAEAIDTPRSNLYKKIEQYNIKREGGGAAVVED